MLGHTCCIMTGARRSTSERLGAGASSALTWLAGSTTSLAGSLPFRFPLGDEEVTAVAAAVAAEEEEKEEKEEEAGAGEAARVLQPPGGGSRLHTSSGQNSHSAI